MMMCQTIATAPLVFVGDEVTAVQKEYKNYVFDLYGTLVDIHTDEENGALWDRFSLYLLSAAHTCSSAGKKKEKRKPLLAAEKGPLKLI